ncbi:MAG: YgeY family selenium metabolism-linked hydrolase [Chloroflexi bacterium HGW-Chloroflexi-10]|nr:MAG: YgeY family selenium metabolism-linked hydrolase [Chloroflexi bacterium HGW-Chloroflexi-10]
MKPIDLITPEEKEDLIAFTQNLIRIKSFSGQEGEIVRFIAQKMIALGFDEVRRDAMGNLLGRIGDGQKVILFDSHVDTVTADDETEWDIPPFSAAIVDGVLHGRGSTDMKSGAAASIYAAAIAKRLGYASGKTIYVSCSVLEEYCNGENLKHLFEEMQLKPDYVIICEASNNQIMLGHKGKAMFTIQTNGVAAHSSAPEKGRNAIYEMAEIIQRVENTNLELMKKDLPRGTLVMSKIASTGASLNAVPARCEAYLDRRIAPGETEETIRQELDRLVEGKDASWQVATQYRKSWTGIEIRYDPFHLAWKISPAHPLTQACTAAFIEQFGSQPAYGFWDFCTNAVTPVKLGIPTIGFGPGEPKLAHMRNERCPLDQITSACEFYIRVIKEGKNRK